MIGIRGTVLKWLSSYILNRSSSVKMFHFSTQYYPIHYGVPLGTVLDPFPYKYTLPIHDIIGHFPDVHYHIYADDNQLYSCISNFSNVLSDNSQLCKYASTIRSWHLSNNILLHSSKSATLNITYNYQYRPPVVIESLSIITSYSVLNHSVTLDVNLSLNTHIYIYIYIYI